MIDEQGRHRFTMGKAFRYRRFLSCLLVFLLLPVSVTGEEERLEFVLPLVAKYNVPVVAISNDDTGISEDPDVRFAVAKKIVERASDYGIPANDIVVDPLVMPIGAMATAGKQVFTACSQITRRIGSKYYLRSI